MATTQYIGARYVPKIYDNPDDNTNNWKQGVEYEPLTMVSYAGGAYTSKVPVPASAANPADAPQYWAYMGSSSGQITTNTNNISRIQHAIANATEVGNICTTSRHDGDYVWIDGTLYQCTADIAVNDAYVEGINITPVTDFIKALSTAMNALANDVADDIAAVNSDIEEIRSELDPPEKYIFIGDSYNNASHHGGWGSKVINQMGLTLGTNVWSTDAPGGGMANGMLLTAAQNQAAALSTAIKESITTVMVVAGANDWSAQQADILQGVQNLETFLSTAYPNAKLILVAGEWGYQTATMREGIVSAYNDYALGCKNMKFIHNAFLLFLDPYFLETDAVHPTEGGMYNFATTLKNILNGSDGEFFKHYAGLNARILGASTGSPNNVNISGDISAAGTHVFINDPQTGHFHWDTPLEITHTGTKIGQIPATNNNFFQRKAVIPLDVFAGYSDNGIKYGRFKARLIVEKDENNNYWNVSLASDSFLVGNNYNVSVYDIYMTFDCMLDYVNT